MVGELLCFVESEWRGEIRVQTASLQPQITLSQCLLPAFMAVKEGKLNLCCVCIKGNHKKYNEYNEFKIKNSRTVRSWKRSTHMSSSGFNSSCLFYLFINLFFDDLSLICPQLKELFVCQSLIVQLKPLRQTPSPPPHILKSFSKRRKFIPRCQSASFFFRLS